MDSRRRAELLATLSPEGRATYEVLRAQLARDLDRCFAESKARLEKGVEVAFGDLRRKCHRVPDRDDAERAKEIVAATATAPALSTPATSHVFPDAKHGPDLASSTSSTTSTTRALRVSSSGITTDGSHESEVAASSSNPAPAAAATDISVSSAAVVAPASGGVPSLVASATTRLTSPGGDTGAAPDANPLVSTGPIGVPASTMQSEADHVLETPVTCSTLGLYSIANAIQVNKVPLPELAVSPERSAAFSSSTSIPAVSASDDSELALAAPTMCSTECPGEGNNATRATPTPTAAPLASLTSVVPATCEVSTEVSSMALMDVSISAPTPTEITTTEMLHPLLDITLGKLAPAKCSTECSELGTHTMMLGDAQSSALSLTMSVPNAQLDSAYKLFNERPWHVDIDNDSKLDKTVSCGNVPVAALTTLNTNSSDLGQELRPLPWPSSVHSQKGEQLDDDYSQEAWLGYCLPEDLVTKIFRLTPVDDKGYGANKAKIFSVVLMHNCDPVISLHHEKSWNTRCFYSCAWMEFVNSKGTIGVQSAEYWFPLQDRYGSCSLGKPHEAPEHTVAEKVLIHDLLDSVSLLALDGLPLKPPWPLFLQLNKGVPATIILIPKLRPFSWFGAFDDSSHAYETFTEFCIPWAYMWKLLQGFPARPCLCCEFLKVDKLRQYFISLAELQPWHYWELSLLLSDKYQLGSPFVQWEIAWAHCHATGTVWFQSCYTEHDSSYGSESLQWKIAWCPSSDIQPWLPIQCLQQGAMTVSAISGMTFDFPLSSFTWSPDGCLHGKRTQPFIVIDTSIRDPSLSGKVIILQILPCVGYLGSPWDPGQQAPISFCQLAGPMQLKNGVLAAVKLQGSLMELLKSPLWLYEFPWIPIQMLNSLPFPWFGEDGAFSHSSKITELGIPRADECTFRLPWSPTNIHRAFFAMNGYDGDVNLLFLGSSCSGLVLLIFEHFEGQVVWTPSFPGSIHVSRVELVPCSVHTIEAYNFQCEVFTRLNDRSAMGNPGDCFVSVWRYENLAITHDVCPGPGIATLQVTWDPGGSTQYQFVDKAEDWVQEVLRTPWDPGGTMQHRLGGKSNLMGEGLSATRVGLDSGPGLAERSPTNSRKAWKQRWLGSERRLRPRCVWLCSRLLLLVLFIFLLSFSPWIPLISIQFLHK